MANSVDPDQTAPIGAVCSGSTLFASILNLSVMLGNYLKQTTLAADIFRCIFFLGALRVKFLTPYLLGNCACFLLSAIFFNTNLIKNFFQEYFQSTNILIPDQSQQNVRPGLGQNCLQR